MLNSVHQLQFCNAGQQVDCTEMPSLNGRSPLGGRQALHLNGLRNEDNQDLEVAVIAWVDDSLWMVSTGPRVKCPTQRPASVTSVVARQGWQRRCRKPHETSTYCDNGEEGFAQKWQCSDDSLHLRLRTSSTGSQKLIEQHINPLRF